MTKDQETSEKIFIEHANQALQIMKDKALNMHLKGVGVICYIPENKTQSWTSKMMAVKATGSDKQNYIAIANSKVAEMAETLMNSGSKVREPKLGKFGFIGGVIKKIDTGYILASFSGATGEEDVEISTEGLNWIAEKLQ